MLKNRIFYLVFLVVAVLFYFYYAEYLSFAILLFALILPIISGLVAWIGKKGINVSLQATTIEAVKETDITFKLQVENRFPLPISGVRFQFYCNNSLTDSHETRSVIMPLAGLDRIEMDYVTQSKYCGVVNCNLQKAVVYDFLGLFGFTKKCAQGASVLVYPRTRIAHLPLQFLKESMDEQNADTVSKRGNSSSDVFEIREYVEGDSLQHIHWKLSSKQDKLMVREFSEQDATSVTFLLEFIQDADLPIRAKYTDLMLEAFMTLADVLNKNRVPFKVFWYNAPTQSIETYAIQEAGGMPALMDRLLSVIPYTGDPKLIVGYSGLNTGTRDHQLLYMTPYYSQQGADILFKECNAQNIQMVYTGDKEIQTDNIVHVHDESLETDLNILTL